MYGVNYVDPEEERKGPGIVCCWHENKKYKEYNAIKKYNLESGMTLAELLKTQRIVKKLVKV
jgi:hypothetical protein